MLLNWYGINHRRWYVIGTAVLWFCVLHSGVHATIAGVLAAFTIPMRTRDGIPLLENFEHTLVGWNAYLVVPIFGFANAGVDLRGLGLEYLLLPLPLAIAAGLVVGKQVGIFGAVWLLVRLGLAGRLQGATWLQVYGVSLLCGIGFTMSLFIGALAFPERPLLIDEAKIGVLLGSFLSAVTGYLVLRFAPATPRLGDEADDESGESNVDGYGTGAPRAP